MKAYTNRKALFSAVERDFLRRRQLPASRKHVSSSSSSVQLVWSTLLSNDYNHIMNTTRTTSINYRTFGSKSQNKYEKEMTTNTLEIARAITRHPKDDDNIDRGRKLNQRRALSKAITLIESRSPNHMNQGDLLLNYLIEYNLSKGNESFVERKDTEPFRIGIAGAPGAGKSSFIEKFGIFLLENHYHHENDVICDGSYSCPSKLAALCIDPSSTLTGGSILGDKTRMTELSRHPKAFVRPSPTRGDLGGVSSHTNDAITLCQAAGYDFVMVETVGIGQSEVSVSQVVDMLILVVAPGGGDGLQGVKKGITEVADLLIVNKADGNLLPVATSTAADYKGATHFLRSRMEGWEAPPVLLASTKTNFGFNEIWEAICKYRRLIAENGELDKRKAEQSKYWMWKHMQNLISLRVRSDNQIRAMADDVEKALDKGVISPRVAASSMLKYLHLTFN